jgi:hypothetical protein
MEFFFENKCYLAENHTQLLRVGHANPMQHYMYLINGRQKQYCHRF